MLHNKMLIIYVRTLDSDKELSSNSESEDDLDTTLDCAVSKDCDIVIGKKRKTTSSNNDSKLVFSIFALII